MRKITALIVDDERSAREELLSMLKAYPMINVVGEAADADRAEELIDSLKPDLVFLDIQLPERNGFDLLEALTEVPMLIFVTAFDSFALKAFEVSALDYLMKPVREERFEKAISKILSTGTSDHGPSVFIKDNGRYHLVRWKEVYLIESMDNYARIFFSNEWVFLKSSLNQLENRLDRLNFFRVDRAHLVNLDFVKAVIEEQGKMIFSLPAGQQLKVSERQAIKFRARNRQ